MKYRLNSLELNNTWIQWLWIQRSHIQHPWNQQPLESTPFKTIILEFNNLKSNHHLFNNVEFNHPWVNLSLDLRTLGFKDVEFNDLIHLCRFSAPYIEPDLGWLFYLLLLLSSPLWALMVGPYADSSKASYERPVKCTEVKSYTN